MTSGHLMHNITTDRTMITQKESQISRELISLIVLQWLQDYGSSPGSNLQFSESSRRGDWERGSCIPWPELILNFQKLHGNLVHRFSDVRNERPAILCTFSRDWRHICTTPPLTNTPQWNCRNFSCQLGQQPKLLYSGPGRTAGTNLAADGMSKEWQSR